MKNKIKLGDLGDIFIGLTYKPEDVSDEGTIVLRSGNIQNGKLDFSDIVRVNKNVRDKFIVKDGDILMCSRNGSARLVGKSALIKDLSEEMTFGAFMTIIRTSQNNYLQYYFKSPFFKRQLSSSATTTINQITRSMLNDIDIPIFNETESSKISNVLGKIEQLIDYKKEQLRLLDDLIKSRFVEMFGDPETNPLKWDEDLLNEHLSVIGGYAFKSEQFSETGIPVLRIGNINAGYFQPLNMVFWNEDDSLKRYMMLPGDLVMSLTGTVGKEDYGNVCILGNDYEQYYLNQRNAKLELKDTLDKLYLSQLLKFQSIKKRLTGISRGVRQANISNKDILNLYVPIPSIELQNQFATFVQQVDKLKVDVQKSLDETQMLFDSLMQQYFE